MKIAIISSRFPHPLDKGDKLRLFNQIRWLSVSHEIHLYAICKEKMTAANRAALEIYGVKIHAFPQSKINFFFNLFFGILNGLPAQIAFFYNPNIKRKINQSLKIIKPDHIYAHLIRTAEYIKEQNIPKTIDYMDCFSLSSQYRAANSRAIPRYLWTMEAEKCANYEAIIFNSFQHHLIIAASDRQAMSFPQKDKINIVQNGLDFEKYQAIKPYSSRKYDILFIGNLSYFSNEAAVYYLLQKILVLLIGKKNNVTMAIAGAQAGSKLKREMAKYSQLTFFDQPADTVPFYNDAKLFVAPIFLGTGQQNKILEAIACGCHCIVSPSVQHSLSIPEPACISVADTVEKFCQSILFALNHEQETVRQNNEAKEYVHKHFSWQKTVKQIEEIMVLP